MHHIRIVLANITTYAVIEDMEATLQQKLSQVI